MPRWCRWILTAVVILLALFFWTIALTVPLIAATMPAIVALAFSVLVYFAWPKKEKKTDAKTVTMSEKDSQIAKAKSMKNAGWSNISIAQRMGISEHDVRKLMK